MAKIVVRLRGEQVAELNLDRGQEYLAGRGADAHIRLHEERGISRHHLKFLERDGRWVVEAMSKFLLMQRGGETLEVIELGDEPTGFTVPPFEFSFEPDLAARPAAAPAPDANNLPGVYVPRPNARQDVDQAVTRTRANNEATVAGRATLTPFLKISYPGTTDDEVLKLEGQLWTAGRDQACEIAVDSPHISRRHFELSRTEGGFFVTDLGSANGTKLNNVRLVAHEPTKLESGDELRVQSIEMHFEIRDTQFANRLGNLPVAAVDPMLQNALGPWAAADVAMPATQYHALPSGPAKGLRRYDVKKLAVRGVIALLALVMVGLSLMPEKKKPVNDNADGSKPAVWDGLTPEKKNIIKDSFALARNLYVQGKYALCQTELRKVHDLIPQYENSKELESFCEQGLELVRRQEDLDRQAREKAAIEQKITGYVDDCKTKLTPDSTVDETRVCLAPAIEMAPEHPLVVEMLHSAQMHEEERKFLAKQRSAEDAEVAKGQRLFDKCEAIYKEGKLPKAIEAYKHFLTTHYPKSEGLKEKARRQLASIEKELATRVGGFLEQCKQLGEKNQYKDAWYACDKALKEDKKSKEAQETRERMHTRLRKEMRAIYEDSVLEESMGNVDTAKEKWKKITAEDIEADDYFTKAKSKLQKYLGE